MCGFDSAKGSDQADKINLLENMPKSWPMWALEVHLGDEKWPSEGFSGTDEESGLREPEASYSNDFEGNNGLLSTKNACFWKTDL